MSLTGVINGRQVGVLADSGSHLNIMSEICYRNLKPAPKLLRPDFESIVGVSGVSTPVMGMAKVKLGLGELSFDITCHVMNGPRNDVIIGREFFVKHILGFDWVNKILKFNSSPALMSNGSKICSPVKSGFISTIICNIKINIIWNINMINIYTICIHINKGEL